MTEDMRNKLKSLIVDAEECRHFPYVDTMGNITIGIGYNLSARGLPESWINNQYDEDVRYFYNQLDNDYKWFNDLAIARQCVLIDMCFMGYKKFQKFVHMLDALAKQDYKLAAFEMMNSEWAFDVKSRADRDAKIMLTGEF